jgi:hypothetical protein
MSTPPGVDVKRPLFGATVFFLSTMYRGAAFKLHSKKLKVNLHTTGVAERNESTLEAGDELIFSLEQFLIQYS